MRWTAVWSSIAVVHAGATERSSDALRVSAAAAADATAADATAAAAADANANDVKTASETTSV